VAKYFPTVGDIIRYPGKHGSAWTVTHVSPGQRWFAAEKPGVGQRLFFGPDMTDHERERTMFETGLHAVRRED